MTEGRFRIEGLVPGQSYTASAVGEEAQTKGFGVVIDPIVLKPGEARDRAMPAAPADQARGRRVARRGQERQVPRIFRGTVVRPPRRRPSVY